MERNLIFTHIPKTGGTTFRYLLERQYGTEHTRVLDGDEAAQAFRNQSPEARQPVRLLMGHMFTGLHTALSGPTDYVTFLRHPVQRILSYYAHVHNEKDNPLHEAVTQHQIGLYDFVQQLDWGNINNTQIRFISGIKDTEEAMLAKAMENIERDYPVVGILERFEESLVAMKHHFGWDISH
ncbi:MAG: sulfotransferase family 2 domain-containing protein, partial [Bacteroidota bacterium]